MTTEPNPKTIACPVCTAPAGQACLPSTLARKFADGHGGRSHSARLLAARHGVQAR